MTLYTKLKKYLRSQTKPVGERILQYIITLATILTLIFTKVSYLLSIKSLKRLTRYYFQRECVPTPS